MKKYGVMKNEWIDIHNSYRIAALACLVVRQERCAREASWNQRGKVC